MAIPISNKPLSKLKESEIREVFKKIYTNPDIVNIIDIEIAYDVLILISKDLNIIRKTEKSDGSFNLKSIHDFGQKYNLEFLNIINSKEILKNLDELNNQLEFKIEKSGYFDEIEFQMEKEKFITPKRKSLEIPFPEYLLINPDNKRNEFAEKLKMSFRDAKGLNMRYMLEGLIKKGILSSLGELNKAQLYRDMGKFFNWEIGADTGIFDPKIDNDWRRKRVQSAEKKIESILKNLD